jgi:hypothetical protein
MAKKAKIVKMAKMIEWTKIGKTSARISKNDNTVITKMTRKQK